MTSVEPSPATRPTDRRVAILRASARLFRDRGYARVSMDDIARSIGISGPALYRHFPSKRALLGVTLDTHLRGLEYAVSLARSVEELAERVSVVTVENEDLGVLLLREVSYLPAHTRTDIESRLYVVQQRIAQLIVDERPAVALAAGMVLARGVIGVAVSTAFFGTPMLTSEVRLLTASCISLLCTESEIAESDLVVHPTTDLSVTSRPWLSRTEAILAEAPRMFLAHGGYESTTLHDLGAAAGIHGPTVYRHFDSKAAVYVTASTRILGWSKADLERALSMSTSGEDVMRRALYSHCEIAGWMTLLGMDQTVLLSDSERETEVGLLAKQCFALWVECVRVARPELTSHQLDTLLRAALTLVHELSGGSHAGGPVLTQDALTRLSLLVINRASVLPICA